MKQMQGPQSMMNMSVPASYSLQIHVVWSEHSVKFYRPVISDLQNSNKI